MGMANQGDNEGAAGWDASADAWIRDQSETGDWSRRHILDPEMERLLGDVNGKDILDLGCGEGRYARILAGKGAKVTGIDPVQKFIDIAREKDPQSEYVVGVAEVLPFGDELFDIVLSYLTLIDIPDIRLAIPEMGRVLRSGGKLVVVTISNFCCTVEPWIRDEEGRKLYRPVEGYMEEKAIRCTWRDIDIVNYHRPLSVVLNLFIDEGLVLERFNEPLPQDASIPGFAEQFSAPNFQTMVWRKL
jgi:SAM-dependent methyltransferase